MPSSGLLTQKGVSWHSHTHDLTSFRHSPVSREGGRTIELEKQGFPFLVGCVIGAAESWLSWCSLRHVSASLSLSPPS